MASFTLIRRLRRVVLPALVIVFMPAGTRLASAQPSVVVDWSTRSLVASPPELGRATGAVVTIRNVNDVLYDYTVDVLEVRRSLDDFALLAGTLGKSPAVAAAPVASEVCPVDEMRNWLAAVGGVIEQNHDLTPPKKDGKYVSVPVEATVAAWTSEVAPLVARVRDLEARVRENIDQCLDPKAADTFLRREFAPFEARVTVIERRLSGPHSIQFPVTLRPDSDYTLLVTERFKGAATIDGTRSFTFSPASTVLTLSAGFGVTWLEGRAYSARNAPGANPGDATRTLLSVDGKGQRPALIALLNYQIPGAATADYGLAIATGPVFAFNSGTRNSSSLGLFAGLSVHLFRRFFISPGLHLGEFADTPLGFKGENDVVPPNFAELMPRKRWQTKFAVMFTFRTADLSKVTPKPKAASPEPPPAKAAAPKDEANTTKKDRGQEDRQWR